MKSFPQLYQVAWREYHGWLPTCRVGYILALEATLP